MAMSGDHRGEYWRITRSRAPRYRAGIGLRNVRDRLRHRFGGPERLFARPLPNDIFAAKVRLPLAIEAVR